MSSPPQLHLSLPPNTTSFKRSFEQFGFDLESPSTVHRSHEPIDGASTSASGESSSTMSSDGDENRRKRARSASSLSDPEDRSSEASSSTLSSFDSESSSPNSRISHSNSSQAAARRHLLLDLGLGRGLGSSVALGLSMASAELQLGSGRAIPEPPPRIPTPDLLESEDIDMPDVEMDFSHPEEHEEERPSRVEHVRRSVDRFNAFDRHISVLRSSSPPVIPLPASLNSRQASLSPPTLPPLPLVDLGLDAEDDDEDDGDQDHIPSTNPTITTTTSTPPRLDLNLPPTTSLSSGPSSPIAPPEPTSSTQFRERLDSAIDGLGGGDLYLEAPILTPLEQRADDGVTLDRYFEPARDSGDAAEATASGSSSNTVRRTRPLVETPLFEWPPALDWNITLGARPSSSTEVAQPLRSPPFSSWRPHVRPANATAAMDTTSADIRRFIGSSYSPPPHPPPPTRLYPRPASLAAPLSVPASTSSEAAALDADLVDAYLDFHRSNSNTRAWESALDRARALHREREREREQERERERERIRVAERERERERQREREEETEREMERPWSLDSIWEANARGESSSSSARSRPWMSLTLRPRRDVTEDTGRELDLELARRRALQRQITRNRETERERRGQPSVSSAARYLESGLVDPREAPRTAPNTSAPGREHRLRPPLDTTSNPFNVTWGPSRGTEMAEEDVPAFIHRSRGSSQSRDSSSIDWTTRTEHDEDHTHLDTFDDWFNFESEPPRSGPPRTVASSSTAHEREGFDYLRASGEGSSSGEFWRTRSTWQPRLAVSPQSTALPARTATHARAQSIPASSLSSLSSIAPQPSHARLRRLYGPSRAAGVGSSNSLVAENAAAIRRQEARTELMQRLNRTMTLDIDAHSDPESDWEPRTRQRARESRPDDAMDSEDDSLPQRVAQAIERIGSRPPLTSLRTLRVHRRSDPSPPRESPPLPLRLPSGSVRPRSVAFEDEAEEEPTASSSGLNSRRPFSTYTRRPVQRLRQHPISGEISPPPAASTTVDRRHVSWEAPSRDAGVSNTYQYLSALSHGFDSQSSSISDMAHTIASNSHTEEAHRSPASPMWGENESPFSTLFVRSPATPFSHRNPRYERGQMPGGYTDDTMDAVEDSSVPSLPPPDLGRNFERAEDVLRSATAEGARASSSTVATPTSDSPTTSYATRAPTPPSASSFTGPFRLTMQRREEYRRLRAANQRQIPDPPSIPPLYFGGDFENPSTSPSEDGSGSRQRLLAQRPQSYQPSSSRSELPTSARFADAERRLFNYRGPPQAVQSSDGDPRRFFPSSRPPATASTSHVDRDPAEQRGLRYSATDMHNVLARQARLEGSRLADLPRTSRPETEGVDITHDGFSSSRTQRSIPRYHERAEAEAREPSSSTSTWAELPPRRSETSRPDAEARRRRAMASRPDAEPGVGFRHRVFRDPSFHAMFAANHGFHPGAPRFRRSGLGDYVRDEDFDGSYETLLSLSRLIGDAKPKATPDHVVSGLETASYKDWATTESDQRCPICLDDYQPSDPVMKLGDCRHWLHKDCLEQWLKGASTCPVCRKDVKGKAKRTPHHHHHHHHHGPGPSRRRDGDGPDGPDGPGTSGGGGGGELPHINWLNFLRD